ncbi:MAG: FecR family protein, partial [Gammaproteobacteria bacterium]
MNLVRMLVFVCAVVLPSYRSVAAPDAAAHVQELEGKVLATTKAGNVRRLFANGDVHPTETITTLGKARVLLLFSDRSKYELGPNTTFSIDRYQYTQNVDNGFAATRILKGFFRFVSGELARRRPSSISIGVPVATIGIRGTHVVGEVTETSAKIGLLPPEEGAAPSAIEVSNAHGAVTINQPNYVTEIPDANSPPSTPRPIDLRT